MKVLNLTALLLFSLFALGVAQAQDLTQTIRGTVIDSDNQQGLPGANIFLPQWGVGTTTDFEGNFRIENVPVGRATVVVSFIGYEDQVLSGIVINSATEVVLRIELLESINSLDEVVVTDAQSKNQPVNEMALVSARTFSVEETKRFAGAIDDPARMVSGFAGVNNDPEGNNDIIVRGNSPRGVLWRLEGVEIPNPNHFSDEGGTGGPINALNSSMLGNSDFYTGAFAPQYGNALSGVFDINLRTGNNEKREYSLQASTLGLDVTAEGPFKTGYKGSYLANYRYSSLSLLDAAGIVDFDGVPKYQDGAFKVMLPINSSHSINVFGFGGTSSITTRETAEDDDSKVLAKADVGNKVGAAGMAHIFKVNKQGYLQTTLSASANVALFSYEKENGNGGFYDDYTEDFTNTTLGITSIYNHKVNAQNKLKVGVIYRSLGFDMHSKNYDDDDARLETLLDDKGSTSSLQGFVEWKHRWSEDLTVVGGVHYLQFMLNQNFAIEPRLAMQWKLDERQTITAGTGLHSRLESVAIYLGQQTAADGSISKPNENLGMSQAAHFVLGYGRTFGDYTNFKAEVYYQNLYNVPIENVAGSYRSMLNASSGYTTDNLVNAGTGENYGIELTLEQYLHKGFYYLGTLSLYSSQYTAMDGVQRNTAFAGRYVVNGLVGKEFKIGKPEKGRILMLNTKLAIIGGRPYTPVDLNASIVDQTTVLDETNPYSMRGDNILKWDLAVGIRRNYKNVTTEWKIDIQNVTNNQARLYAYFDETTQGLDYGVQLGLFPTLSYRVTF